MVGIFKIPNPNGFGPAPLMPSSGGSGAPPCGAISGFGKFSEIRVTFGAGKINRNLE
jgi:hypothetical protein